MKLFDYISGGNSAKTKIPMTAPVVTKIEPGQGPNCESTFTMSFYNPYSYQVRNFGVHYAALAILAALAVQYGTVQQTVSLSTVRDSPYSSSFNPYPTYFTPDCG